jgi:hypothetical protein
MVIIITGESLGLLSFFLRKPENQEKNNIIYG